jgi:hypothetical protein
LFPLTYPIRLPIAKNVAPPEIKKAEEFPLQPFGLILYAGQHFPLSFLLFPDFY